MQYRTLGTSGAVVSSYALGTMTFGAEATEEQSHAILDDYVAAGGNFIDTADVYVAGASEEIIGRWLAARPGARRESLEAYVKRLERIEEIAAGKSGVEKVFAMQAGREVRVMVRPEDVDDACAHLLARDVAKQIEEELTYPGQIRVTVVRESRVTEIAR